MTKYRKYKGANKMNDVCPGCCPPMSEQGKPHVFSAPFSGSHRGCKESVWTCNNCGHELPKARKRTKSQIARDNRRKRQFNESLVIINDEFVIESCQERVKKGDYTYEDQLICRLAIKSKAAGNEKALEERVETLEIALAEIWEWTQQKDIENPRSIVADITKTALVGKDGLMKTFKVKQ